MCSSLLPGPLPLGDGSKPFDCYVLFPTGMLCGIRVLSLSSGPGSHCQSISVSVKGTLSCLHGLGKQAYLGGLCQKSEAASRLTSYPGLSSLRSEWARPGRTVDATRNSLQSRTCDWLPCTLSVSNECLTDGIHALFNLPLIEVRDEQAKESIKKWSHHSLGLSQFVTGFIRRGEKAPLRLMNF